MSSKSDPIKITHYINPHEFWFKYEKDDLFEREYSLEIEREIEQLSKFTKLTFNYSPVIGEIVILRCCFGAIDKLIRARVDCEHKYKHGSEFTLWAIDEGYPIRSNKKWISKMVSKDLQGQNPFIYKGTLNKIVPATAHFNFMESGPEMVKTQSWSQKAINQIENIISDAETLIFHFDRDAANQHHFGSVEVLSRAGKSTTLHDVLKSLEEAVSSKNNFEQEYLRLTHKDYWDNQQEHYKIKENGKHTMPQQDVKVLRPKNIQEINIVDKMNDWDKRNQRSIQNESPEKLYQAMEKCNINDLPHNKRYEYIQQQSKTSDQCSSSTKSQSSSCPSFHSANYEPAVKIPNNFHFIKALQQESGFCTKDKDKVLMHCPEGIFVSAIENISEANFTKEVHEYLPKENITSVYRIQAVGWPHLMRGHSLILVNRARTAKTWTYLPAVCSLLSEAHSDGKIVESDGPVMIIICMNSLDVEKQGKWCTGLLGKSNQKFEILTAYGEREIETFEHKLLNGVDILVTTVPCLLRLMARKIKLFNKKRISTIVFDEIDAMCDRFGDKDVDKIYNKFCKDNGRTQFIVTSKTWNKVLKRFCAKNDVLLCIGAYIEAAIYSNVDITLQSVGEDDLDEKFLAYMKSNNYLHEATVVVCNTPQEVRHINTLLTTEGATVVYCHDKTDSSEIDAINRMINQNKPRDLGVLVCSDDVRKDLNMRNAQHIIHYSLPSVWDKFTERFLLSFDYYENLVQDRSSNAGATSVIFVNEESFDSLPRLIEFMRKRCYTKVPKHIVALAEKKRIEREESRSRRNPFCNNHLLFGNCPNESTCSSRHIFTKFDRSRENIPRNGDIKFQIIKVHNPAHYTVRLLEHRVSKQSQWQKIPHCEEYLAFHREFKAHFNDPANRRIHYPPQLDDLCAVEDDEAGFLRAKIETFEKEPYIKLLLIDSNEPLECKKTDIMVLDKRFQDFPPQAVELRIGGVVPHDLDPKWDQKSTKIIKEWLDGANDSKVHIEGEIDLTLMDCIWLKSMLLVKKLTSIREEVPESAVHQKIIEHNIGVANTKSMQVLREMAEKMGILDNTPHILQLYEPPKEQSQLRARRNRGSRGSSHHSSSESIHSQTKLISSSPSNAKKEISVNSSNGCLSTTSESEEVSGPQYQQLNSSSDLSDYLPTERWAELVANDFNEVIIGKCYEPNDVYVYLFKEKERLGRLYQKIDEFTGNTKNIKPLIEPQVGQICLSNYNYYREYVRAKILDVYIDLGLVDLRLLDTGVRKNDVPLEHVIAIPPKLIERLPFQAILCRIVGIRPSNGSSNWSVESCDAIEDILFRGRVLIVRTVGDRSITDDALKCNAYDGVYLEETSKEVDIINKLIVAKGLAELDPQTEHFLDILVDWKVLNSGDGVDNWDEDRDEHFQPFDAGSYLSSSDGSEKLLDIDIQFTEEDINKFLGLPPGAKFIREDEIANQRKPLPAIEDVQIEEISCTEPLVEERRKSRSPRKGLNNQLIQTAKIPYVIWEQTDEMIIITIAAPDVTDYYLNVGLRYVRLNYKKGEEDFAILLNLYGCVEMDCTTHEIRGLNIVLKLLKTLPGRALRWPRLVQSPDKNRFIRYKLDRFEEDSDNDIEDGQNYNGYVSNTTESDEDDDDDEDGGLIEDVEL